MQPNNQLQESRGPLTGPVLHILLALAEGERHGYAIMKQVEANTRGLIRMGPGTLYTNIKKMMAEGLIEESCDRPDPELDDERRRYYRLTSLGGQLAAAEIRRLTELVQANPARRLLERFA